MFLSLKVLDACAAPGNKTAHLAALMRGQGKIIACELNEERVKVLETSIRKCGAHSILLFGIFIALFGKAFSIYFQFLLCL